MPASCNPQGNFVFGFYFLFLIIVGCWLSISWWLQWVFVEISLPVCQPVHSLNLPHAILLILYILHQKRWYQHFPGSCRPFLTIWNIVNYVDISDYWKVFLTSYKFQALGQGFSLHQSFLSPIWHKTRVWLASPSWVGQTAAVLWLGWLVWLDMIDFITVNTPNNYPDTTSTTFHSLIMLCDRDLSTHIVLLDSLKYPMNYHFQMNHLKFLYVFIMLNQGLTISSGFNHLCYFINYSWNNKR